MNYFRRLAVTFWSGRNQAFQLGDRQFAVTEVLATPESGNPWSTYADYAELIDRLKFVT